MPPVRYAVDTLLRVCPLITLLWLAGCASQQPTIPPAADTGAQAELSMERALILVHAKQAIGVPYRYGGATMEGVDCSGLVAMAYRAAGLSLPRTANDQYQSLPAVDKPRPGDLLFFGSGSKATHVGIYRGNRQMIHAPGSGRSVVSVPLDIDYWQSHFLGAAGPAD